MRIQSEDRTRDVSLEVVERLDGDLHLTVEARLGDFTGGVGVWVEGDALKGFLQQLEALERTRQGLARLESMSPGELVLVLRSVDALGHAILEVSLRARHYATDVPLEHRLVGGFAIDPSLLPKLLQDFRRLAAT